MNRQQFDHLLEQAIAELPLSIRRHIVNVAIVV
jgi:predicted Zn-dependent protease with MMP-like domain